MAKNYNISADILNWYDVNRRHLPWRSAPGEYANPYHIWLSEIMLQQTTVATVKSYFEKFLTLWPTLSDMAAAPLEDILKEWAGLGYYARARNLHKCAQFIQHHHNGRFPETEAELLSLPGIGPYTAAAITSIAFHKKAVVVDGNIERVMSRLYKSDAQLPKDKKVFYQLASQETPNERCGDYAQALMDLGATICTPKSPKCIICPIETKCCGKLEAERYPLKAPKKKKPEKVGACFWIKNHMGDVLLYRRPEKGLLGGMPALPTSEWIENQKTEYVTSMVLPPLPNDIKALQPSLHFTLKEDAVVTHVFTHFKLTLSLYISSPLHLPNLPEGYFWCSQEELTNIGLPTLFMKAVKILID